MSYDRGPPKDRVPTSAGDTCHMRRRIHVI
jgi:hypothetical protein